MEFVLHDQPPPFCRKQRRDKCLEGTITRRSWYDEMRLYTSTRLRLAWNLHIAPEVRFELDFDLAA